MLSRNDQTLENRSNLTEEGFVQLGKYEMTENPLTHFPACRAASAVWEI